MMIKKTIIAIGYMYFGSKGLAMDLLSGLRPSKNGYKMRVVELENGYEGLVIDGGENLIR